MNLRSSSFLGVSVNDRSIVCAEVSVSGGKREVRRLATFSLGEGVTFDKPTVAGEAFLAFLRQKKFSASRAVVGIPAKWMLAIEKEIPPSGEEQARGMLRLQAERLGVSESGEMVFDYAGRTDTDRANKVLLVGVKRQRLEQIEDLLDAAGLSVVAITSSALALAGGAGNKDQDVPMLLLGRQGAEMVWRHDGMPKMLRHVSVMAVNGHGPVTLNSLGSELGRTLALSRGSGTNTARELLLWDGVGLSQEQVTELADRSGVAVRSGDVLKSLRLDEAPDAHLGNGDGSGSGEIYAPALSLALAGADRALLPLDFRKSRLTARKARRVSRQGLWAIIGGGALVLLIAWLFVSKALSTAELEGIQSEITNKKDKFKDANQLIDRYNYARGYFEGAPPYLDCLAEIAKVFVPSERIWVTSVSIREDDKKPEKGPQVRRGTIMGHAVNADYVRNLRAAMNANKKFSEVGTRQFVLLDAATGSPTTGRTQNTEVNFTMSFSFIAE